MKRQFLLLLALCFLILSCSSTPYKVAQVDPSYTYLSKEMVESQVKGRIDVMLGPVPVEDNKEVSKWIHYFQNRGRPHMVRYLERSTRYHNIMKAILREEGMPEDLFYISLIESGFNPKAYSRAAAVGFWQFLRSTGRRYGLKINAYVDERKDVIASTRAAANYFKSLYNLFGNWYLAMASYNAGENRIKNVVMKYQTRNFWELAHKKKLPRETMNYIPKFLAATLIAKNPNRYGFMDLNYQEPIDFDFVQLTHTVDLKKMARHMNISYQELRKLNPALLTRYVPVYRVGSTVLKIPKGRRLMATVAMQKSKAKIRYRDSYAYHRVQRGDTLSRIARIYKSSVKQIQRLNNLNSRSLIRIGQKLKVPPSKGYVPSKKRRRSTSSSYKTYKVRKGDTLSGIAQKFKVSQRTLRRLNKLSTRSVLKIGQRLRVSKASKKVKRSLAKTSKSNRYQYHFVKQGESLYVIAKKYSTTVSRLKKLNSLSRNIIKVGQSLIVSVKN